MLSITADCLRSRRHDVPRSEVFPLSRLAASSKTTSLMRSARGGFTLVELLTVIAIIGILSAITFGVVKGVNERAAIGQAKAELGTIAQALENYKRQYGDYPQVGPFPSGTTTAPTSTIHGNSSALLNALYGWVGPKNNTLGSRGKGFIDLSKLSLVNSTLPTDAAVQNAFIDPWGRQYIYSYRTNANDGGGWKQPGYILFSAGPDGRLNPPSAQGVVDYTTSYNSDNVYSHK